MMHHSNFLIKIVDTNNIVIVVIVTVEGIVIIMIKSLGVVSSTPPVIKLVKR